METKAAILEAKKLIISHDKHLSLNDLIEPNLALFSKFRLISSTNNIISDFGYTSLDKIEAKCSCIKKFFNGSGLLFFSEDIYQTHLKQENILIPLDYSLSFDSNVAENFRIHEKGGKVSPKEKFERLTQFIKEYQFNFDYGFFFLENFEFINQNNERPFNTLRAIIRWDSLINTSLLDREEAGKLAIQKMFNYRNDQIHPHFWQKRKKIYLVLLRAIRVNWNTKEDVYSKLKIIIEFCLEKLGKFAKKEIYLAWKLFKYGNKLDFFAPVNQPSKKTLSKAKGMSWDFLSIEYQSMLAYNLSENNKFFVPFFASFDNRFVEFAKACPVRCMLLDDREKKAYTFFDDELEFIQDMNKAIEADNELYCKLSDWQEIQRRSNLELDNNKLDVQIANLEKVINDI